MNRKLSVLCLLVGLCLPTLVNAGPLKNMRARWNTPFVSGCATCAATSDQTKAAPDQCACKGGVCSVPSTVQIVQIPAVAALTATASQDNVDLMQAVIAGFGSRLAIGPYHFVTTALRAYLVDFASGNKAGAVDRFSLAIGRTPNPARACRIATFAVVILPFVNSFQPIPDYAEVLAGLEALEAAACGTPVPVPTK
jgi:hypothetical protein